MNSHLQSIIEKCHLANPKLLESTISSEIYKVQPITLQDILLAMGPGYSITCGGLFFMAIPGDGYERFDKLKITNIRYDMSKIPYDQEESVLEFISKNI